MCEFYNVTRYLVWFLGGLTSDTGDLFTSSSCGVLDPAQAFCDAARGRTLLCCYIHDVFEYEPRLHQFTKFKTCGILFSVGDDRISAVFVVQPKNFVEYNQTILASSVCLVCRLVVIMVFFVQIFNILVTVFIRICAYSKRRAWLPHVLFDANDKQKVVMS